MTEEFRFDAWSQEHGVRRNQEVRPGDTSIRVGDVEIDYESVRWKARRADLLVLFTPDRTLALQGRSDPLNRLNRALTRRLSPRRNRRRYLESVAGEVLLFAAAVAARGRVDGGPVTGLRLAVVTRDALHLFSGDSRRSLSFPVEECRRGGSRKEGPPDTVVLRRGDDLLELVYLFPEEREVLVEAAR